MGRVVFTRNSEGNGYSVCVLDELLLSAVQLLQDRVASWLRKVSWLKVKSPSKGFKRKSSTPTPSPSPLTHLWPRGNLSVGILEVMAEGMSRTVLGVDDVRVWYLLITNSNLQDVLWWYQEVPVFVLRQSCQIVKISGQ